MKEDVRKLKINRKEIYRYLEIRNADPDPRTEKLVESVTAELYRNVELREFHQVFPLRLPHDKEHTVDFGCFQTHSRSLEKNLKGCSEVILLAATIGPKVDLLLRRYSLTQTSRGVVMQAASAEFIESWCNLINERLKAAAAEQGLFLRPRFSPGYGDFPLENQKELFQSLQVEKRVGIALTGSYLMVPSKSVTAVIGAGRQKTDCAEEGCGSCGMRDCPYRAGEDSAARLPAAARSG